MTNFQRGKIFEEKAIKYFEKKYNISFNSKKILTGLNGGKFREFDLVNLEKKILIECKNMSFTKSGNVPSAKISDILKEIYKLYLAPNEYKKIMCLKYHYSEKHKKTLGEYIRENYYDFLPNNIEIVELK